MAPGDLRKELECFLCKNVYTDPVTLKCGHNFCRVCIDGVLNTQEGSGVYSCPQCREKLKKRPVLPRNTTLHNIVEQLPPTLLQQKTGAFCTYCIHSLVPAAKSCLMCEASLCDKHLRVHSKKPAHVLSDPTTSLESRVCSIHKAELKYYCTDDSVCICESCRLDGEHRGHQVETLDEASERKKSQLKHDLQKLMMEREGAEKKLQTLQERKKEVQGKADSITKRVTALISDLITQLKDLEKRVLIDITGRAERVSRSHDEVTRQLEMKKEDLSRKIHHIEELCNMTDPLIVLQEPDTGDLWKPEQGDDEDKDTKEEDNYEKEDDDEEDDEEGADKGVDEEGNNEDGDDQDRKGNDGEDLDEDSISYILGAELFHIMEEINVDIYMLETADILLDVNTADNKLHISEDRKTATRANVYTNLQEIGEGPLSVPQVLSCQSFSTGQHHWDVDVRGSEVFIVGVSYGSIDKSGLQSVIGYNNMSWGLIRMANKYILMHEGNGIELFLNTTADRIRIYLDYEEGQISFYALCKSIMHLHTFTATFTEPLHAALGVYTGCLKISGGEVEM